MENAFLATRWRQFPAELILLKKYHLPAALLTHLKPLLIWACDPDRKEPTEESGGHSNRRWQTPPPTPTPSHYTSSNFCWLSSVPLILICTVIRIHWDKLSGLPLYEVTLKHCLTRACTNKTKLVRLLLINKKSSISNIYRILVKTTDFNPNVALKLQFDWTILTKARWRLVS